MPLIRYTAGQNTPDDLDRALALHSQNAPVIVMIHGFKFSPGIAPYCPFADIFSPIPPTRARAVSWPRHLGVGRSAPGAEPLCIAFGWPSRGSFWAIWRRAWRMGRVLAAVLAQIADAGHRPGIIAHSLGARVALSAVARARPGDVGRLVLMAGAVFARDARRAMDSPAGRLAEVLNVTSRENAFFDLMTETALGLHDRSIGRGLPRPPRGWLDLWIDDAPTRDALRAFGHPIRRSQGRMCHWSGYLRPGLFGLYRRWLGAPANLPLALLAQHLPTRAKPVWAAPWLRPLRPAP